MKSLLIVFINLLLLGQLSFGQSITLAPDNPPNPTKGTLNYNNATNLLRYWNGTAWISLTNTAGTGWVANGNDISNTNSGNVGIRTSTPEAALNVGVGETVIFGKATGPGSKLIWYGYTAAFRAGYSFLDEFDEPNVGNYSIGLGSAPVASGTNSIAIGTNAKATAQYAMALGSGVTANGHYSTAMGVNASTNNHANSFCINGTSGNEITSNTADNQMMMRFDNYTFWVTAANYAYLTPASNGWAYTSDRTKKENFQELNGETVLKRIATIPFYSWNFKAKDTKQYRHYGIMAQDFYQAFGRDNYGAIGNDTTVSPLDLLGVAYSGIKALEKRTEILQTQNEKLIEKLVSLALQNQQLSGEIDALKAIIQPKRRRTIAYKNKVVISEKLVAKK